jgi:hypothetical protein
MKKILVGIFLLFLVLNSGKVIAQTINWKVLDKSKHIAHFHTGLQYAFTYGMGYAYVLDTNLPVVLHLNVSMPTGTRALDDFKSTLGGQIRLLKYSNFVGSLAISGVYRKYESSMVKLVNFGGETKVSWGYYKPKWFVAAEAGFDKAVITHFKHSQRYKELVYAQVQDGWKFTGTGGNFYYGLSSAYSFKRADITVQTGKVISQDFKTPPTLPFYMQIGFNYRFEK